MAVKLQKDKKAPSKYQSAHTKWLEIVHKSFEQLLWCLFVEGWWPLEQGILSLSGCSSISSYYELSCFDSLSLFVDECTRKTLRPHLSEVFFLGFSLKVAELWFFLSTTSQMSFIFQVKSSHFLYSTVYYVNCFSFTISQWRKFNFAVKQL